MLIDKYTIKPWGKLHNDAPIGFESEGVKYISVTHSLYINVFCPESYEQLHSIRELNVLKRMSLNIFQEKVLNIGLPVYYEDPDKQHLFKEIMVLCPKNTHENNRMIIDNTYGSINEIRDRIIKMRMYNQLTISLMDKFNDEYLTRLLNTRNDIIVSDPDEYVSNATNIILNDIRESSMVKPFKLLCGGHLLYLYESIVTMRIHLLINILLVLFKQVHGIETIIINGCIWTKALPFQKDFYKLSTAYSSF